MKLATATATSAAAATVAGTAATWAKGAHFRFKQFPREPLSSTRVPFDW